MNDVGTYSLMFPLSDRYRVTDAPIEGFREHWEQHLIDAAPKTKRELAGYLTALFLLRNAALPPAYSRSLPIYRLQLRIERIIGSIEANNSKINRQYTQKG